ncbi:DNA polymerase IV [Microbacterium sp. YY-01]|uniref:DNA polymerase IV n=1 Tax=Microbacterium sp. YY-01 TaxID=3421634 RepID=UPI003D184B01
MYDVDDARTGILHVDMDAFYASVAVLDDPTLRGLPIIIGSPEGRSVVSSASYEARRYGVRSAMPVAQAIRLCPAARIVRPDFERYRELSHRVMAIFESITPLVEQVSIDEAFLDVRGAQRLWGSPATIARLVRERIHAETGLTCSVGVAATKHIAKMASTMSKPDGLLVVPGDATQEFLDPLSVRALWGVGPRSAEQLEARGIRTIKDVRLSAPDMLRRAVGATAAHKLQQLARGHDDRQIETERQEKSVGHEHTFQQDVADHRELKFHLQQLSDRVAARLRQSNYETAAVAIKVRFADFTTVTRTQTLPEPSSVGQRIGSVAQALWEALDRHDPVRLIGVRAERLTAASGPAGLWDDDASWRSVEHALDAAHSKFGDGVIRRARYLDEKTRD